MSTFHNDWYQQRYGDAQRSKQHRQDSERVRADYAELDERRKKGRTSRKKPI
ncbi:hypothetical protein [Leptolyngbya sp. BC1307]|uniref:hypothetical protein n=1 Tax=Leptolyngbya sp. BC1307 TaxID=2029589 RepID=UPI0014832E64|nr:hypothetical protein [Leptolyngbya sp. BC1307]